MHLEDLDVADPRGEVVARRLAVDDGRDGRRAEAAEVEGVGHDDLDDEGAGLVGRVDAAHLLVERDERRAPDLTLDMVLDHFI